MPLTALLGFAFIANLPLGYLRHDTQKYSWRWFLYIHLSIPFIIALRLYFGFTWNIIPVTVAMAVAGQIIGSRYKKRKTS